MGDGSAVQIQQPIFFLLYNPATEHYLSNDFSGHTKNHLVKFSKPSEGSNVDTHLILQL